MDPASAANMHAIGKRRALLIGNNNYKRGNTLRYSINNAQDLYVKLGMLHFQATLGMNLACDEMEAMFETFVKEIGPGDLVFLFYSGYTAHWENQNYFIPVNDNEITTLSMFKYQAVNVYDTLKSIMDRNPLTVIIILDACRSYLMTHITDWTGPFDFGGLISIEAFPNSFIMFPCQPNKTIVDKSTDGRHTTFISHILEYIEQPNLPFDDIVALIVDDVLNETNNEQVPYQAGTIRKNLQLNAQSQAGMKHRLNPRAEKIVNDAQNKSLIDLGHQDLTDRDMATVIQDVIIKKQCSKLWLPGNKITFFGITTLSNALPNNTTLERLYLYNNRVCDKGVKPLAKVLAMNNNALKVLNLQEAGLTDIGAEYLSEMLKKNTILTVLTLGKNDIGDTGVRHFAHCLKKFNNTLQCLDLSKNKRISDMCLEAVQEIIESKRSLNELSIYDCSLSKTGKEKIRKLTKAKKHINVFVNNWDE